MSEKKKSPVAEPKTEAITKETANRIEYHYHDENGLPIHKCRVVDKKNNKITVYPYSYNESRGLSKKRVEEIELRGWSDFDDLPRLIKPQNKVSLGHKKIAPLLRTLHDKFPKFKKLIIAKNGTTRLSAQTVSFSFGDLETICRALSKEQSTFEVRRKTAILNGLSAVSNSFKPRTTSLSKGGLSHFLSFYEGDVNLSAADTDSVLDLIAHIPMGSVTVTENFIQTKNKVNVAYLEKVIDRFEALMDVKSDNEKDWQEFFDEHGWILASIFPYQVILYQKEAYVGGKTIENKEGRVVDFLYQNGFRDNYALLEIKTHNKQLVKSKPYREPDAFAQHEDCSGAISQCLDQKNTFLKEMGKAYSSLDPKVVLITGMKGKLTDNQARAFELLRSNQRNVDIVTFDEVLEKILGLRSILQK